MGTVQIKRGDTINVTATVLDTDGGPFDFSGATVWFTVKERNDVAANDDEALITAYWEDSGSSSGITITDPDSGIAVILAESAGLRAGISYAYDLQVEDLNGDLTTVDRGIVSVSADVTRRTTTP